MLRLMCKSKIHRARVTHADLHYEGSMGIDKTLLEKSDIYPGEIIQVVNVNNGSRFETYAVAERAGSGKIALYGAAARLGKVGDLVIIFAYGLVENRKSGKVRLKVVRVDPKNNPL